ncbi:S-adenosylmethionine decarboxylase [Pleurotus eryngii]|uniref:adenosylmethionine decarboxylase n=1 Tax=Pleurotus eryngii TaxID=5323 RepID=A0A9P6A9Z6_PLEER|nr:S-adenosylmethionine decarboxylase [Pleurotus eryngii]
MPESAAASAPFEGPEKLLEIWFAPSASDVPDASDPTEDGRTGLRKVKREIWEEMLDIVRCKILSIIDGSEVDAYLLSESSFFVSPHRLILKTCGTTLNLLGLPRILNIASSQCSMSTVFRVFYSRKSFMFPERQQGPHRDWKQEVEFLDGIFQNGAAYTVGKVNGDHWLLYMTIPDTATIPASPSPPLARHVQDSTIEILMSDLASPACQPFHYDQSLSTSDPSPSSHAQQISAHLGISDIFPPHLTVLDGYSFSPCGYSCNALIKWARPKPSNSPVLTSQAQEGEGYYTIHVTPEEGWSYASFECNIPLSHLSPSDPTPTSAETMPDLVALVQRVVRIFQPGRLSLTLFISSQDNENEDGSSAVEEAQRAFKAALTFPPSLSMDERKSILPVGKGKGYRRTDKINYEFRDYDLAFASFELLQ